MIRMIFGRKVRDLLAIMIIRSFKRGNALGFISNIISFWVECTFLFFINSFM